MTAYAANILRIGICNMRSVLNAPGANSKVSFGRTSAAIVILMGLAIVAGVIAMEYIHPTKPIDYKMLVDSKNVVVVTRMVPNHDWNNLGVFLAMGITPLAALLYGGGKIVDALQTHVENGKING